MLQIIKRAISHWPALTISAFATLILTAILLGFAANGWPTSGSDDEGEEIHQNCFEDYKHNPNCFCERLRGEKPGDVWFAQPVNSISNIAFTIVGLSIAYISDARRSPTKDLDWWTSHNNVMTQTKLYPIAFSTLTSLMGPGSTFLHASFLVWGQQIDILCMLNIATFLTVYGLVRFLNLTQTIAAVIHGSIMIGLILWIVVFTPSLLQSRGAFTGLLLVAGVIEGMVRIHQEYWKTWINKQQPKSTADLRLFFCALGTYGLAMIIWFPSRAGGPLCNPDSFFQGHAVWHVLCSVVLGFLFLYALSEQCFVESSPIEMPPKPEEENC